MDIEKITDKLTLRSLVKSLRGDFRADRTGWAVLKESELMLFRGVNLWVGFEDGEAVTLNATHFGKRKKNVWEPYANWYIAFTSAEVRRRGHATTLARYVQEQAREAGCVRLKALAGTFGGLHLHAKLGDELWAITDKMEVQVDTPLHPDQPKGSTPPNARKWTDRPTPLTVVEVYKQLNGAPLRYCDGENAA